MILLGFLCLVTFFILLFIIYVLAKPLFRFFEILTNFH